MKLVRTLVVTGALVGGIAATAMPANAALLNGCVSGERHVAVEVLNTEVVEVCY
ncbi:MAG TPA: hypothetical protein VGX28_15065 [Frankiaceae bacterium]|jgi:hypothetical protein|nr:hypothetical protein [Frankiaceae bacterium]